jgi:hypothetical protein
VVRQEGEKWMVIFELACALVKDRELEKEGIYHELMADLAKQWPPYHSLA